MNKNIKSKIHQEISKIAKKENKQNYERYFKNVIKFYGLKTPDLKEIFKKIWPDIKKYDLNNQISLAFELFQSDYSEDKSLAIKILDKNSKYLPLTIISDLERIIDKHVYDWATCDMLSGRVLRYLIVRDKNVVKQIINWKKAKNNWRNRAAAVSFVNLARHGDYNKEIIEICQTNIKNPERFVQLGTGWVLRELSLADLDLVVSFIKKNYRYFSREGLRYAIEKMNSKLKKELLEFKKN